MSTQQIINLLVPILIVGFSVLSWVFRKLSEAHAKRQAELARERAEIEALRTGPRRDASPAASGPTPEQLAQAEARRQAQLQELRRRQLERMRREGRGGQEGQDESSAGQEGTTIVVGPVSITLPGNVSPGPTVPGPRGPRPGTPVPARTVPTRGTPDARRQARERAKAEAQRRAEAQRQSAARTDAQRRAQAAREAYERAINRDTGESEVTRLVADQPAAARSVRRPATVVLGTLTLADVRRAFVLGEVLGPPRSLRPVGEDVRVG